MSLVRPWANAARSALCGRPLGQALQGSTSPSNMQALPAPHKRRRSRLGKVRRDARSWRLALWVRMPLLASSAHMLCARASPPRPSSMSSRRRRRSASPSRSRWTPHGASPSTSTAAHGARPAAGRCSSGDVWRSPPALVPPSSSSFPSFPSSPPHPHPHIALGPPPPPPRSTSALIVFLVLGLLLPTSSFRHILLVLVFLVHPPLVPCASLLAAASPSTGCTLRRLAQRLAQSHASCLALPVTAQA